MGVPMTGTQPIVVVCGVPQPERTRRCAGRECTKKLRSALPPIFPVTLSRWRDTISSIFSDSANAGEQLATVEALLSDADRALYGAKAQGRNQAARPPDPPNTSFLS